MSDGLLLGLVLAGPVLVAIALVGVARVVGGVVTVLRFKARNTRGA